MSDEEQKTNIPTPDKEFVVKTLDTLKVIADPLRIHLLELLVEGPRTVKQVAAELNISPTKLYYHINLLEEHGLIRVVSTRVVQGIIEKQYFVTAYSIRPDVALLTPAEPTVGQGFPLMISSIFEHTRNDIEKSLHAGLIDLANSSPDQDFLLTRNLFRLPKERAREFVTQLKALMKEYHQEDWKNNEIPIYGLMTTFYPTQHSTSQDETEE